MTRGMRTTTRREIRASLGRYLAIAAIIALGVGFFAGLRNTTTDMIAVTDKYLKDLRMFDYRMVSTLGFTDAELMMLREDATVVAADGEIQHTVIGRIGEDADDAVYAFHSITSGVNELKLAEGRMPERADECVADVRALGNGCIGKKILISENNGESADDFSYRGYTIVGTVFSPLYLNYERGTTELLNGSVEGFIYIDRQGFASDIYTSPYYYLQQNDVVYVSPNKVRAVSSTNAGLWVSVVGTLASTAAVVVTIVK